MAEFGRTSLGKPMYVAFISSAENLKKLERYREISRRLALGEASAAEARTLANEGRAIVWIDSGLHASEVAPVQHSPELAYRMLTDESAEVQAIRREVILPPIPPQIRSQYRASRRHPRRSFWRDESRNREGAVGKVVS